MARARRLEQGSAEMFLQLPDPLADRCLRQPEVFGGGGKAAEPRRRFEGADPFERWKTIRFISQTTSQAIKS
jgi:hypothetical protein